MCKVIFHFNGKKTRIECKKDENMKIISEKFLEKIGQKENLKFIYNGKVINDKLTFFEQADLIDRKENEMIIQVEYSEEMYLNKDQTEINTITLKYKIDQNNSTISLFGKDFVKNNKDKCNIIYEGKEYELQEYIDIENKHNISSKEIIIYLKGIDKITDINHMFYNTSFFFFT